MSEVLSFYLTLTWLGIFALDFGACIIEHVRVLNPERDSLFVPMKARSSEKSYRCCLHVVHLTTGMIRTYLDAPISRQTSFYWALLSGDAIQTLLGLLSM